MIFPFSEAQKSLGKVPCKKGLKIPNLSFKNTISCLREVQKAAAYILNKN